MEGPKFEFYVLNENFNRNREIVPFNIFNNSWVYQRTLAAVKKYCRSPKKYYYDDWRVEESDRVYGFEGFCMELDRIIMSEEWSRCEYEIIVDSMFDDEHKQEKKIDCYYQAKPNIEVIAREVIYQYRQWKKEKKNG